MTNEGTQTTEAGVERVGCFSVCSNVTSHTDRVYPTTWFPEVHTATAAGSALGKDTISPLTSAAAALPATWGSAEPSQGWAGKPARAPDGDGESPAGSP